MEELKTKNDLLAKLRNYAENPDDDIIRYKQKVKETLLNSPELLYALCSREYESELFNDDGSINYDGDWSVYFGDNIRPYLFIPETQSYAKNYLCYRVEFDDFPQYNKIERVVNITFVTYCNGANPIDKETGIPRHNLIMSIIRELFNWSNIFGTQCKICSVKERTADYDYLMQTTVFQLTTTNAIVQTSNGKTSIINNMVRK